jgi:helicase MOV-10
MTYLGTNALFRLNSLSRPVELLPKMLKPYSLINDNVVFAAPPLDVLLKFRLVVSTCVSGGIPSGLGFTRGHFTHIFIDEAGQATEPEAMVHIEIVVIRREAE